MLPGSILGVFVAVMGVSRVGSPASTLEVGWDPNQPILHFPLFPFLSRLQAFPLHLRCRAVPSFTNDIPFSPNQDWAQLTQFTNKS